MHVSRKVKVAVGAAVAVLAISGAAFAYFTTSGGGTATGAAGTSTALAITGNLSVPLYPGTASEVTFAVDNTSTGNQFVDTISLVDVTASNDGVVNAGCLSAWFSMPTVTAGQDISPGGETIGATGTITMANLADVNQDACKLATLTLNLTSN